MTRADMTRKKSMTRNRKVCQHGKDKYYCKDCKGKGMCSHGKRKTYCIQCKGKSICEHSKRRVRCKKCPAIRVCKLSTTGRLGRSRISAESSGTGPSAPTGGESIHANSTTPPSILSPNPDPCDSPITHPNIYAEPAPQKSSKLDIDLNNIDLKDPDLDLDLVLDKLSDLFSNLRISE